jgi:site-specific DNA-methyltransferase (cytosine-N4-specific)
LTDNGGAIAANVLQFSNTSSVDPYLSYCQDVGLPRHPARMPVGLAEFLIQFLTEKGDLVIDPFAGSNITGRAAENLGRKWVSVEVNADYVRGSIARFKGELKTTTLRRRMASVSASSALRGASSTSARRLT